MPKKRLNKIKADEPGADEPSVAASERPHSFGNFPIVGIGASAGGLEACKKLLDALPGQTGMAFILVQHLDPTHESMMVELLAGHTAMHVLQAADGMLIEPDHIYTIPPGTYLSVANGALRLSQPQAPHGARLPFDFLLHSLAENCGPRAICVVLSGTGADGSLGLRAIKEKCGLVIAQDLDEAAHDGMPRSAVMTGAVDLTLPIARIAETLVKYGRHIAQAGERDETLSDVSPDWLPEVIDLLRRKTAHDFSLYKPGTVRRRIERRMAMAAIGSTDVPRYVEILRSDPHELDLLAKDLYINVTSFFRDPKVFDHLAAKIIPDLVKHHAVGRPLRIWVAGCSTGEEAYSLAMLFFEQIAASRLDIKLQVFASDIDTDAVAVAREGVYPESIATQVSPARLARFFSKEERSYKILPELRSAVVFTVQDVLSDPPFSRIDLVSCRNLLIYLQPKAQAKVISLFNFALREGGILLLGSAESIGDVDGRFEVVSKADRIYRHIGRNRTEELGFLASVSDSLRAPTRQVLPPLPSRQSSLAELSRRLVIDTYAPAAVLINRKHECLYYLGPTDRYLKTPPGYPSNDLLGMASPELRIKLRSAIQQAEQANARVTVARNRMDRDGREITFRIEVQPATLEDEQLFLVCFVDEPERQDADRKLPAGAPDETRVAELERELAATRTELKAAIRSLEISNQEQKVIIEEALSVSEEYQSTNEELLTSKEELQSLNEELTALNSQLQETLERQRTSSDDLQNILYSTDVATIFLDTNLNIRFFTPATKSLFRIIPGDIGRPVTDLSTLASDGSLIEDVRAVLQRKEPVEREVEVLGGAWHSRRILPYRTQDGGIGGVVITLIDITERKRTAKALEAAKHQAEQANIAKSRFLAAASHDLRQPLHTLTLLQGLLAKKVKGEATQRLVALLEQTLDTMRGMLNTLLDINQIDAGVVHAEKVHFPINDLLKRMKHEFSYEADALNLELRVVPCSLSVNSDPRLLEQMVRNILSNALKYTKNGKILLGCRRHGNMLSLEVLDTGIGIPGDKFSSIFDEYYQIDNVARERSRGLGLGLSIVERLGSILNHRIRVRSQPGKGSAFCIEIALDSATAAQGPEPISRAIGGPPEVPAKITGKILVIEDEPEVSELLSLVLEDDGHHVITATDGPATLDLVARGMAQPDLIIADYNLPNGMNGLQAAITLRERFRRLIPVIILTGDISTESLRNIALLHCLQLNKPAKLKELTQAIHQLLAESRTEAEAASPVRAGRTVVYVVDDEADAREAVRGILEESGHTVRDFATAEAFLDAYRPGDEACLLIDAYLPGMSGLELLQRLNQAGYRLPAIMITGHSDVPIAVQAMKAGASDFIEKPIGRSDLLTSIDRAIEQAGDATKTSAWREEALKRMAGLTQRQRQIMGLVLAGHPSKNIAADLGISQRTVENHRAAIMRKTGSKSLPALARLALAAGGHGVEGSSGRSSE